MAGGGFRWGGVEEVGAGGFGDAVDGVLDLLAQVLLGPPGLLAVLRQPRLGLGEDLDGEQPFQQLAALQPVGAQEAREVALRQHRHLAELVGVHPQQPAHQVARLVGSGGQPLPAGAAPLLDDDLGLLLGAAGAAELGPLPGRGAVDAE